MVYIRDLNSLEFPPTLELNIVLNIQSTGDYAETWNIKDNITKEVWKIRPKRSVINKAS